MREADPLSIAAVAKRLLRLALTVLFAAAIGFGVFQVLPGDPAQIVVGLEGSPTAVQAVREEFGLDRPLGQRFCAWMAGLFRGDLGRSFHYRAPVASLILARLPLTAALAAMAAAIAALAGLGMGVAAAARRGRLADWAVSLFLQLGLAVPAFWLGILAILFFSLKYPLFPPGGYGGDGLWGNVRSLILPAFTLAAGRAAVLARLTRASMNEVLAAPYITVARARGVPETRLFFKHGLKNAVIPVMTTAGLQIGGLIAGSIVVERVFSLPGLGTLLLLGVSYRDLPLVQGLIVFYAFVAAALNLAVDLSYGWIDPRIRRPGDLSAWKDLSP